MNTRIEVLQACTVEGNIIKLPAQQLERKLYEEVADSLKKIGGAWKGGKVFGFVFKTDPTELLSKIAEGEKINIKQDYQFFPTPAAVADRMIEEALDFKKDLICYVNLESQLVKVLEPSAGQGALIDALYREIGQVQVYAYELEPTNRNHLKINYPNVLLNGEPDYLKHDSTFLYDLIIANPPFKNNQDIDHIYKMYDQLGKNGRIVTLASTHWMLSINKKENQFRQWLTDKNASVVKIAAGAFAESGTKIETVMITINK